MSKIFYMVVIVFLAICLICATFNLNMTISGMVVSISRGLGNIADRFLAVYNSFFDGTDFENWYPDDEVVSGSDGSSMSPEEIRFYFDRLLSGDQRYVIHYLGHYNRWNNRQNLYYFYDNSFKQQYFRIVDSFNWGSFVGGETYTFEVYYLGTSYNGETWRQDGIYLFEFDASLSNGRPFDSAVVIDESLNGY